MGFAIARPFLCLRTTCALSQTPSPYLEMSPEAISYSWCRFGGLISYVAGLIIK